MHPSLSLPLSALELCEAIRHARPFNPRRLDRVLRVDGPRGLAEVQASASWNSVVGQVRERCGEAAEPWSAMPGTVGEAVAANAAGPDGHPMVRHVEGLVIVTVDGELRRVSRESHAELFALAVGGQGLFGTVYSVILRLESLAAAGRAAQPIARAQLAAGAGSVRPMTLFVPAQAAEAFIGEVRTICSEWRVEIAALQVRRAFPESETVLRWAKREYAEVTLALAQPPALGGSVRATQLRQALIDLAVGCGGSFPIGCTPEATRAQVEKCYPELRRFLGEKRRLDPAAKLCNAWHRRHASLLARESCEVRFAQAPV